MLCISFSLYSKVKKEEEERQAEWAKKYRDRVSYSTYRGRERYLIAFRLRRGETKRIQIIPVSKNHYHLRRRIEL